jgi:putative Mn2+ efflux pump MntP
MSRSRVLFHMVRADFLERVRRYSFLLTLGFSVYLGYAMYSGQINMQLGSYRGVANSAWLGSVVGLIGSVFLSLIGFYVVKNTIQRDRETRVGRILAATPMSRSFYTLSKALSNLAVLSAMAIVLSVAAVVIQLTHKGAGRINLFDLLSPILIFSVGALSITAALAVLFETIPGLRGGVGNIAYFFLWCFLLNLSVRPLITGQSPSASTSMRDYTGITTISGQMQAQLRQLDPEYKGGSGFYIGSSHRGTKTFVWNGVKWHTTIVLSRIFLLGVAVLLTLIAAGLFDRFDPAREIASLKRRKKQAVLPKPEELDRLLLQTRETQLHASDLTPLVHSRSHVRFVALVLAELRLLLRGQQWWWYTVAAGLFAGCLFAPLDSARSGVILVAWLWPALLWSQLGTREVRFSTQAIIFSAPHAFPRQLLSSWTAGVVLALLTGGGLGLRLMLARDTEGLFGWAVAALFIPALALAFGVCTESRKSFEAVYTAWWYIGPLHQMHKLDFIGTQPASSTPVLYLAASMALLLVACFWRKARLSYA